MNVSAMKNWQDVNKKYIFKKELIDMVFVDEIQFPDTSRYFK